MKFYPRHAVAMLIAAAWIFSFAISFTVSPPYSSSSSSSDDSLSLPSLLKSVHLAMEATSALSENTNVTNLHAVCDQWHVVMTQQERLPPNIRAMCHALHASSLARIGQDELALQNYDQCLQEWQHHLNRQSLADVWMGKALVLQRLMRYQEARDAFLSCGGGTERAVLGAATCCLRLGDHARAKAILENFLQHQQQQHGASNVQNAKGMLGTLLCLEGMDMARATSLLRSGASISPLYRWGLCVNGAASIVGDVEDLTTTHAFDVLDLAEVNQSPFDDPSLRHLDDKVLLHDLLTTARAPAEFWPLGFVLPRDVSKFRMACTTDPGETGNGWILKQRAGYGSHGNQLMSAEQALLEYSATLKDHHGKNPLSDACLCQKMVHPPLLIQGRKFSLRLYVLYFSHSEPCFLCHDGLVKLASVMFRPNQHDDERMHMTNSGREDDMPQHDMEFLQGELERAGHSFDDLWTELKAAVAFVMETYRDFVLRNDDCPQSPRWRSNKLAQLGIPKILGFDFLVDANGDHPKLVEVNRFPGLEPRGNDDVQTKQAVVHGAWACAAERLGLNFEEVGLCNLDKSHVSRFETINYY